MRREESSSGRTERESARSVERAKQADGGGEESARVGELKPQCEQVAISAEQQAMLTQRLTDSPTHTHTRTTHERGLQVYGADNLAISSGTAVIVIVVGVAAAVVVIIILISVEMSSSSLSAVPSSL